MVHTSILSFCGFTAGCRAEILAWGLSQLGELLPAGKNHVTSTRKEHNLIKYPLLYVYIYIHIYISIYISNDIFVRNISLQSLLYDYMIQYLPWSKHGGWAIASL